LQNLLDQTAVGPNSSDFTLHDGEVLPLIEAILFTAVRDVTLAEICEGLGISDKQKVMNLVKRLMNLYESRPSGLMIRETVPGKFVLSPKTELMAKITVFMRDDLLDPNELRTLALIAYQQPITRVQLRKLRSSAPKYLPKLIDLEFVRFEHLNEEEVLLTTGKFADYFGLSPDATDIKEILGAFLDNQESD
jgi:chromosome segregation and condensation protein ScpB